jgi:hypothetical protein
MSVEAGWILDKQILYVRYSGTVTMVDIEQTTTFFVQELLALPEGQQVNLVLNNDPIEKYDIQLAKLATLIKNSPRRDEAVGYVVAIVNPHSKISNLMKMTSSIAVQLTGARFRIVNNYGEATTFLRDMLDPIAHLELPEPPTQPIPLPE